TFRERVLRPEFVLAPSDRLTGESRQFVVPRCDSGIRAVDERPQDRYLFVDELARSLRTASTELREEPDAYLHPVRIQGDLLVEHRGSSIWWPHRHEADVARNRQDGGVLAGPNHA